MAEKRRININIDHSDPSFFTDNVTISHNPKNFIFDFTQITPRFDRVRNGVQQSLIIKHRTVVMSPTMAKSILEILDKSLKGYEKNFGKIKLQKRKIKDKPIQYSEEATRYIG